MKHLRSHKPGKAAKEAAWSKAVKERDGYICRLERWNHLMGIYVECGSHGSGVNPLASAHIIGRPHLSPKTIFDVDLGITACATCHSWYDSDKSETLVRVPPVREERAYNTALAGCKVAPPRRRPPERHKTLARA